MFLKNKKIVATIYGFNTDRKVAVKDFILWDLKWRCTYHSVTSKFILKFLYRNARCMSF